MCGRFALFADRSTVASFVQAPEPTFDWDARYNIAPTQSVIACRLSGNDRELVRFRWGLIPSWAKDPSAGVKAINARAETLTEKPFFRTAFQKRRCLIPASGYFEWKTTGKKKQPFFIHQGELVAFAGLWELWAKGDEPIFACTIITTAADETMLALHERTPVILPPTSFATWLDPLTAQPKLLDLLRPARGLSVYPVGTQVGNVRNQGPDLVAPIDNLFPA
jgi:putative SOS response-associated peptidase YedK